MDKNDVYGRVIYINLEAVVRADDTGDARGAMAPPLFCKIILFVFSAKHSFSSSRVWILYINN